MPRRCPVCGSTDSALWGEKLDLKLTRCSVCQMIFRSGIPTEFQSGAFYEKASVYYLSPDKIASDLSPVRYERELRLFRKEVSRGSVLDVGCGTGGFLFQLGQRYPGDYERHGTDVAGPALEHAEKLGTRVHRGSFLDGRIEAAAYDAVTFWAVLEHLVEPAAFLRQAERVLRPGGICIALVPNMGSLAVRLLGMKYRYILPQHLNYFSKQSLVRLFQISEGWTIRRVRFTHFNPVVVWQDARESGRFVSDEERAALLSKTTALKQRKSLSLLRGGYALAESLLAMFGLTDNVVVVAEKAPKPSAA